MHRRKGISQILKMPPVILFAMVLLMGSGTALWLSGMSFSGTVTVSTGSAPGAIVYAWDIMVTDDSNVTNNFDYFNTDGYQSFLFDINTTGINSTDGKCDYQENQDLQFVIVKDSLNYPLSEGELPIIEFEPGNNTFSIITVPHIGRCPLNGVIAMSATLVE